MKVTTSMHRARKAIIRQAVRISDTDGYFPHPSAPQRVSRALLEFLAGHAAH